MKIAVHEGTFHADEVFAIAIIKFIYTDFELIRTRNDAILCECDLRIDVGGKNNPETGDFDHHLTGGAGERKNGIPFAACGLVWRHFGSQICKSEYVYDYIEKRLIQNIDALDNGYDPGLQNLDFQVYNISDMIDSFNRVWYEENNSNLDNFLQAVSIAKTIIENEIKRGKGFEKAISYVKEAVFNSTNPFYVILEKYCPWQDVLIPDTDMLFVIFPALEGGWRVRTIPQTRGSFQARKKLPAAWSGKRSDEFASLTGVKDATFCHPACFIAGAETKEGAIKLAEKALS
ncbi:MAG: MYG1 family protein [Spirochaetes bacterium]|nr:MYG1 family protein [Spirochaetota bacterium]